MIKFTAQLIEYGKKVGAKISFEAQPDPNRVNDTAQKAAYRHGTATLAPTISKWVDVRQVYTKIIA